MKQLLRYMNPVIEPSIQREIDRNGLKSIHTISLVAMLFECFASVMVLVTFRRRQADDALVSVISVNSSALLCALACFLSKRMLKKESFSRGGFILFKTVFYVVFSATSILFDFRNYRAGQQMVTFYIVNLILVCFIHFKPWVGAVLTACSYASLLLCLYSFDGAAQIQTLNLFLLALASIASSSVRYHSMVSIASNTVRLAESNAALEKASRSDGLTGLLNRLALQDDARKMDGCSVTVYMIDVNFFKEINDRYGHAVGDIVLKETSEALKKLYPGGYHYRYGGDEFLIMTDRPPEENYASDTYVFLQKQHDLKVFLSIGSAQGSPADDQELFELISRADKALYEVKQRTHSVQSPVAQN